MNQTVKNICIFIMFLLLLLLWEDARPYIDDLFSRKWRGVLSLWVWSTMVVVFFHMLYFYIGKIPEKGVYLITLLCLTVTLLLYYGVLDF